MPSLSFDPVAHAYDATRGYPEDVALQIARALEAAAGASAQTAFLEVGVGTGRIALPLASLGHIYTGVDISPKMAAQLETKLLTAGWQSEQQPWGARPDEDTAQAPEVRRFTNAGKDASLRLALADITALPFYDATFDVALAVHIFHLVDGWQRAVSEVLRVLRPGGLFLHCWDEDVTSGKWSVEMMWQKIMRDMGYEIRRSGSPTRTLVTQWLVERGLQPQETRVARWEHAVTPRQAMENVTKRLWSSTWSVPDAVFEVSVERLWNWAQDYFGADLDTPYTRTTQFVICKTAV
ncbi:MAG: class I SAM-dependent methyltransferase [Ktedonobacteraceae bacterium]|nr:class I SAM-dependent methyltransferase [Chloroflexota bacterium]